MTTRWPVIEVSSRGESWAPGWSWLGGLDFIGVSHLRTPYAHADAWGIRARLSSVARPKSLELSQIADAALAVIDREGLAGLSMRAVAAELGVGTMSLYRYVESREALEIAVVDRVLGEVDVGSSGGASWKVRVTDVLVGARGRVAAHPNVIPLLVSAGTTRSGALLSCGEAVLGALGAAGLDAEERAIAFRTLIAYLIGAVQVEHYGPVAGRRTDELAAVPTSAYPAVVRTAESARKLTGEQVFRRGLAMVLAGIGAARE